MMLLVEGQGLARQAKAFLAVNVQYTLENEAILTSRNEIAFTSVPSVIRER